MALRTAPPTRPTQSAPPTAWVGRLSVSQRLQTRGGFFDYIPSRGRSEGSARQVDRWPRSCPPRRPRGLRRSRQPSTRPQCNPLGREPQALRRRTWRTQRKPTGGQRSRELTSRSTPSRSRRLRVKALHAWGWVGSHARRRREPSARKTTAHRTGMTCAVRQPTLSRRQPIPACWALNQTHPRGYPIRRQTWPRCRRTTSPQPTEVANYRPGRAHHTHSRSRPDGTATLLHGVEAIEEAQKLRIPEDRIVHLARDLL